VGLLLQLMGDYSAIFAEIMAEFAKNEQNRLPSRNFTCGDWPSFSDIWRQSRTGSAPGRCHGRDGYMAR
jgi:hypothetical protein